MPKPRPRIARQSPPKSAVKAEQKKARSAPEHYRLVGLVPDVITGRKGPGYVHRHHLKEGFTDTKGLQIKNDDRWIIPINGIDHDRAHNNNEGLGPESWLLKHYGIQSRELAAALWKVSPDVEAMERVVRKHHDEARLRVMAASRLGGVRPAADGPGPAGAGDAGRDHGADAA